MPNQTVSDQCAQWLQFQQDVRVEGSPQEVAPGVHALRGRAQPPSVFRAKFAGVVSLFAAAVALMADARPAPAREEAPQGPTVARAAAISLGGLGLGAFALGRRFDRTAPGLSVLAAAAGATLDERELRSLVTGARKDLSENSWSKGPVWLVAEGSLAPDSRAVAAELGVRCFLATQSGVVEV